MFVGTSAELATKLNVDYLIVQGLVKFLASRNLIKELPEKRKAPSGKGKPSSVWEISGPLTIFEELK